MTIAAFPSISNPAFGFRERRQRNVVGFAPETGIPKMRRRSTAVCVETQAKFELDDADLATFKTFYETTLKDGTLPFTWTHPVDGQSYTWMFSADAAPEIEATTYGFHTVTCEMLRLPS